jgi:hypothetical protein
MKTKEQITHEWFPWTQDYAQKNAYDEKIKLRFRDECAKEVTWVLSGITQSDLDKRIEKYTHLLANGKLEINRYDPFLPMRLDLLNWIKS